jgi:hypothetical protein
MTGQLRSGVSAWLIFIGLILLYVALVELLEYLLFD